MPHLLLPGLPRTNRFGRNAVSHCKVGDVASHDRAGSDDRVLANAAALQHGGSDADGGEIAERDVAAVRDSRSHAAERTEAVVVIDGSVRVHNAVLAENRIAVARKDYIESVSAYNSEIRTFPGRIWHSLLYNELEVRATFAATTKDAEEAPKVEF